MALAPLATTADLTARGISTDFLEVDIYLEVASSEVRTAAGSPISQVTSTVTLFGYLDEKWLHLPGGPVTAVSSVSIDDDAVTDYRRAGDRLWRELGWASGYWPGRPSEVDVTYTHGLATVPAHIVDLVCAMVAAAKSALDEADDGTGLAMDNGTRQSVGIDGFTESYSTSEAAIAAVTAMTLPDRTRLWLASQFGGGTSVLVSR